MKKVLLLITIALTGSLYSGTLSENFESYPVDKTIEKQNGWGERAYGRHPSCKVTIGKGKQNQTRILIPFGGGDRHVYKKFPIKQFREIIADKVIVLDFSFIRRAQVELAPAGRYSSGTRLSVKCGNKFFLRLNKKMYAGIVKIDNRQWNDVRLIIEKTGKEALVTLAYRKRNAKEYIVDPEINKLKLHLTPNMTKYWTGTNVRIDGGSALDDIVIKSYKTVKEIPGKMNKGEIKLSFAPILDHITLPRKAVSLCGKWSYFVAKDGMMPGKSQAWQTLVVPDKHSGIINSAGKGCVYFRKEFKLVDNKKIFICFERVTDSCEVFVNGHKAGASTDGHFPFKVNLSPFVRSGSNTLIVKVLGPKATNAYKNRPQGWPWFLGKFAGIPYPVHLETTGDIIVSDVFVKPHVGTKNVLEAEVAISNLSNQTKEIVINTFAGKDFTCTGGKISIPAKTKQTITLKGNWKSPRLWWPHDPHLYYLTVQLLENGKVVDAYKQRFGFRELRVAKDIILLNNRRMLHRRSSIIPYWPRSIKQETLKMFQTLKKRGYNGSRLHGGSNLRIIRTADEFGWLMSPESAVNEPRGHAVTAKYWPAARAHLQAMIKTFRNNPSVVYWCLSNEFASYYMKGSKEEKAKVDARMVEFGKMTEKLDPTRTWTCSGDGELGGVGQHGHAPTLSYHYAWQPFKTSNMIPNTAYWLTQGLAPWQGIVWDKTKPVMLSEDLYPPYALKPPHGMTQWAGEKAYDLDKGMVQAWFEACRMLCDGYYYAPVSCWNPWGTNETSSDNPLYSQGQLMPDYHIAVKESGVTFHSGAKTQRTVMVYNQLFRDLECQLKIELTSGGKLFFSGQKTFHLKGGAMQEFQLPLHLPVVDKKTIFKYTLTLVSSGKILTQKSMDYTAYPPNKSFTFPADTVLLTDDKNLPCGKFFAKVFTKLDRALKSKPRAMVIAGRKEMTKPEGDALTLAAAKGLNILWIEMSAKGWTPVKVDEHAIAAFNFVRAPEDPALQGLDNHDFKLWQPNSIAVKNAMIKPAEGSYDIILDCYNSLSRSALMRLYSGRGSWLLCQLPVISNWQTEPASSYVFLKLVSTIGQQPYRSKYKLDLVENGKSELAKALNKLKIPFAPNSSGKILAVDGSKPLNDIETGRIDACCKRGGTVFVDGLNSVNASTLSRMSGVRISLKPSGAFQVIKNINGGLLSGLSNSDLYWAATPDAVYKEFLSKIKKRKYMYKGDTMLYGEIVCRDIPATTRPGALLEIPYQQGRILINTVNWRKFLNIKVIESRRYVSTLLHNLGVSISSDEHRAEYIPVNISYLANRGFHNGNNHTPGWFGNGDDDMRYFPVNRTGIDPELKVPCPVESFPSGISNYGGIDFKLINPDRNHGKSCLIATAGMRNKIRLDGKIAKIWMLGAASENYSTGTVICDATLNYTDGSSSNARISAGVHLNGYQSSSAVSRGIPAWTGITPKWKNAILWCWNIENKYPQKKVTSIVLNNRKKWALIAITVEK